MNIIVKGKDFYYLKKTPVAGSTNLIVQGEVGNTLTFKFNTENEHEGLSALTFKLWYVRRDKQGLDIALGTPTVAEDGTFTIDWTLDNHATYYSGQFVFCLAAYNGTERVWKTKACPITIARDVEPEIIDPEEKTLTYDNILSYFEDWVTEKLGQPNGIATLNAQGKVPAEQIDVEGIDNLIFGYYFNGQFYQDSEHTTLITPDTEKLYFDKTSGATNKLYTYNGSAYQPFSSASKWSEIEEKPFQNLGSTLKSENGLLNVNTVDVVQTDNTLPITSNGVAVTVGNINALLQLI